jgi:hypothetical protein
MASNRLIRAIDPLARTRAAKQEEEDLSNLTPRPTEEEYWASGRPSHGILQINQAECGAKDAVAQVECVAWGWEDLAEAATIAEFANYLLGLEDKERAKGLSYVAITQLPVTLALPNGKKEMHVPKTYRQRIGKTNEVKNFQLTNSEKWVNELVLQFREYIVEQATNGNERWKKGMTLMIGPDVDSRCKKREGSRVKKGLTEYACNVAKMRARVTAKLEPAAGSLEPAPFMPELWETVFEPKLSVLMVQLEKHWTAVFEKEYIFNALIAKLKDLWDTMPLSMVSRLGAIKKKVGSKIVYAPDVGSRPVYPPGVEPPLKEEDDDEEEEEDSNDDDGDDNEEEEEKEEEEEEDSMQVDPQSLEEEEEEEEEEDGEHNGAGGADEKKEEEEEEDAMFTD